MMKGENSKKEHFERLKRDQEVKKRQEEEDSILAQKINSENFEENKKFS